MKKTSIRTRLMTMMIGLAVIPVLVSTLVATHNIRSFTERELVNANKVRVAWSSDYLDELIGQLDKMFYSLQINEPLIGNMTRLDHENDMIRLNAQKYLGDTLSLAYYANSEKIDALTLYADQSAKAYTVSYVIGGELKGLEKLDGYWSRLETAKTNLYFSKEEDGIYAVHSLNRFMDQTMYGGLAVKIRDDVWDEVGRILEAEDGEEVAVFNDQGESIFTSAPWEETREMSRVIRSNEENRDAVIQGETYYYFLESVDEGKLTVMKRIPTALIRAAEIRTIRAGIMIAAFFIAIALLLSIVFSYRMSKPIIGLAKTMKSADLKGLKLDSGQSPDEIALLQKGYEKMVRRLTELIEEEYQHEIELKNAQLMALQTQINPHFLNNSLNLISGMALERNAPKIYEISKSISDLLRYAVSGSDAMVPLADELKQAVNYLHIQETRFEGRCRVAVEMEEGIGRVLVPKFIIQPVIENAFEYGLQPKRGKWELKVKAFQTGKRLGIAVKDNGIGMDADKLAALRERLKNPERKVQDSEKGIGLVNVALRLKWKYRKNSGIRVFSQEGEGTLVLLVLHLDGEEEKHAADHHCR